MERISTNDNVEPEKEAAQSDSKQTLPLPFYFVHDQNAGDVREASDLPEETAVRLQCKPDLIEPLEFLDKGEPCLIEPLEFLDREQPHLIEPLVYFDQDSNEPTSANAASIESVTEQQIMPEGTSEPGTPTESQDSEHNEIKSAECLVSSEPGGVMQDDTAEQRNIEHKAPVAGMDGVQTSVVPVNRARSACRKNTEECCTEYDIMQHIIQHVALCRYHKRLYRYLSEKGYYEEVTKEDIPLMIMRYAESMIAQMGKANLLYGIGTLLKSTIYIPDVEDPESDYVCFRNGVLDLNTRRMNGYAPYLFFTHRIEANCYDQRCAAPRFSQYLVECMGGNTALISRVWEMLGYLLVPDNAAKCFFLLRGEGDSGKSVLGNLIGSLFSDNAVANLDIFRLGDRFSPSALLDKRINICMDLPNRVLGEQAIGMIKMLTGNDMVTVEEKYQSPRKAKLSCKLVFGSNHALRLAEDDEAFYNRLIEIPFIFPVPAEKRDTQLLQKLLMERDAIVSIAVQSYYALYERRYVFSGAADTANYLEQLDAPGDQADSIAQFIADCCSLGDAQSFRTTQELHLAYQRYCAGKGIPALENRMQFSRELHRICGDKIAIKKKRVNGTAQNGYTGINLKTGW